MSEENIYFNPELFHSTEFVSVWINVWFEQNNEEIGWFDQDFSEGTSVSNKLRETVVQFHRGFEWVDKLMQIINFLSIKVNYM